MPGERIGNVYIEFVRKGKLIKVSAIDEASGTEVSIFGPGTAARHDLIQAVLSKLKYVMHKKTPGAQ